MDKKANDIKVREATPDDYEAVMAIDTNIYDGYDYLPKMYHTYMKDPRRTGYVLEVNGRIVSKYTLKAYCLNSSLFSFL